MEKFWKIGVNAPLFEPLTYFSKLDLSAGDNVRVSLGKRVSTGIVLGEIEKPNEVTFEIKEIFELNTQRPKLTKKKLMWLEWVSEYYHYPIGLVSELCFPPLDKKESLSQLTNLSVRQKFQLNEEQLNSVNSILSQNAFQVHFLLGITGSGKTEVYLEAIEKKLCEEKSSLFLVPEISLTPQLVDRFQKRLGKENIAVFHSQLTPREKTNEWWHVINGSKKVLIGARSALFVPIPNLGLIVIDEEHEPSYKQEEKLKYNARDSAIKLAQISECPIVLGSATPSLESWKNIIEKKYYLHKLTKRATQQPLPQSVIIDLKLDSEKNQSLPFWLGKTLYGKMIETLDKKEQVMLFLNRRGMAHQIFCGLCGYTAQCPNCSVTLTLHGKNHMLCHYCDYHENLKAACPDCKENSLKEIGLGTEKIEEDLIGLFPNARIARADRDLIQTKNQLIEFIRKMEDLEIDILIGTQMIAKGLDFQNVTLVGVVLADIGLSMPDFRASERSFQLISQVSGRSGRHRSGEVVIQTYNPSHPSITYALANDFEGFAQQELEIRKSLNFPPYGKLTSIKFQSNKIDQLMNYEKKILLKIRSLKKSHMQFDEIEVLGPCEAPLSRLRGKFRHQIFLKHKKARVLKEFYTRALEVKEPQVQTFIDVDPYQML